MDTIMEQPARPKAKPLQGRTEVILPPDLREAIKQHSERTGATLAGMVRLALKQYLDQQK